MSLKHLNEFLKFDPKFFHGLKLAYLKDQPWYEGTGEDRKELGRKVTLQVMEDANEYTGRGSDVTNQFEQLVVKTHQVANEFASWRPMQTVVEMAEIEKASVYGDYRNQLSVTATLREAQARKAQ